MTQSRKNTLTATSRRTLMNIAAVADQLDGIQLDIQTMRRQVPPNVDMMEFGEAQRQLVASYNALHIAYRKIREVARKAGESV